MFLRPGVLIDATWADEVARFVEDAELPGNARRGRGVPQNGIGAHRLSGDH